MPSSARGWLGRRGVYWIEGQTHLPWERIEAKPPPNYTQEALTLKGSEQEDAPVNDRTQNATASERCAAQRRTAAPVAGRTFSKKPTERNSEQVPRQHQIETVGCSSKPSYYGRSRYVQACVLTRSKEPEEYSSWIRPGDSISPRHSVMVAGPEKDILRGREFAKGDVWRKMKARQAGHLQGIHRSREVGMCVGRQESSQVKKHGRFWKCRRRDDLFPVDGLDDRATKRELKKRESEKKRKAEIGDLEPGGAEFQKGSC
jgi:hypothetical protein